MVMKKQHAPQTNLTRQMSQPKPGGDYSKDAHGPSYHQSSGTGQAFGKVNATAPMDYVRKTQAEGNHNNPVAGAQSGGGKSLGMAEHHKVPNQTDGGHLVGSPVYPAKGADGFGHGAHVRSGPLRMSGVKGAHRVGKR